jgi:transcriptional regulator with XRE-family HTH domain
MQRKSERRALVNTNILKGTIVSKGMTQAQAAQLFGMSQNSLSRKMLKKRDFTLGETLRIKEALTLTDQQYADIFLNETSHFCNGNHAKNP